MREMERGTGGGGGSLELFHWLFLVLKYHDIERWLSAIMWQIYFQSNLNLFSAGSSVQQTLIHGTIV